MAKKIDKTAGAELIAMAREAVGDGPETADVHPDEVPGFIAGGWRPVEADWED